MSVGDGKVKGKTNLEVSVMSNEDYLVESPQNEVVPIDTLEKIADARAFELWSENIGRGEPIPLSDTSGIYAYVFPYILNARQFPSNETVFGQVRALRSRFKGGVGEENLPADYYSELRQMGNGFGSICVSARYTDIPVLWMSHFLPPYFITAESTKEEAKRRLREDVRLRKYYYFSPEEQYMEFATRTKSVLLDVNDPSRIVPHDALRLRSPELKSEELAMMIRESWARLTASPSAEMISENVTPKLAPGTDIAPKGLRIDDISETHTVKKIAYWELIPIVDHTPKNWCVPTSWAMVLGFYDNYMKGKGTLLGYGRLIDYWYELTPGGFNLPNLIDDWLSPRGASTINNYTFPETKSNGDKAKQWNMLKGEVDAGRPCFFNIPRHTTAAFGYRVSDNVDKFAIVYDPPNPNVPTYVNEYNLLMCTGVGAVTLGGGTDAENLIMIEPDGGETFYTSVPNEIIWFVWGNSIKKTKLSISEDGGNTWKTVADSIPTKGAWNGYAWIGGTSGTRVRVKVEGLTTGNELIAADGSFKNLHVKLSPSGSGWKKIWGPTSLVLASSVADKADLLIYAVPSSGDGIYRYDGAPMTWTKVGGPGKMFALDDYGQLYGLSPDGNGVYRYNGIPTKWTQIGGPAGVIYAGGGFLFATNPQTGDIYQYEGTPMIWTKVGGPGKMFSVDHKGRLYGVSPNGSAIFRYDGTPMKWTQVAQQSTTAIYSGGCGLYAVGGNNNDVFCYSIAPLMWTKVGGPGKMFAVDDTGRLYGLSPDGSGVFRYEGAWNTPEKWTKVGGAAGKIFAGGNGRLFATNPQTNDLMSYE